MRGQAMVFLSADFDAIHGYGEDAKARDAPPRFDDGLWVLDALEEARRAVLGFGAVTAWVEAVGAYRRVGGANPD